MSRGLGRPRLFLEGVGPHAELSRRDPELQQLLEPDHAQTRRGAKEADDNDKLPIRRTGGATG